MLYNIDFDLAAVVISLFTVYYLFIKKSLRKNANKIYMAIVFAGLISSVSDVISAVFISYPDRFSINTMLISVYVYLIVHNSMPYLFFLYIMYVANLNRYLNGRVLSLISIPFAASIFIIALNPTMNWAFYIDEAKHYLHGPMFTVLYVVAFLYLIASVGLTVFFRKAIPDVRRNPLYFFVFLCVFPIIVQMIFPTVLVETFFQAIGFLGVMFSIETQDELIDSTTKIYNRYAFRFALEDVLLKKGAIILTVKLPMIHYYNTTIGVDYMGDILREIAEWFDSQGKGIRCHYCGIGHFALVCENYSDFEITDLKRRIFDRFRISWGRGTIDAVFPIQICSMNIPEDFDNIEEILLLADVPFDGSESVELDAKEAVKAYHRRIKIEKVIHEALESKSFQVWYQPIWDMHTNTSHSAEALLRLFDDELGAISPEEFIPIAEQDGTIIDIGYFVFEEVCKFYVEHRLDKIGIDYIEVNLSMVQCMDQKIVDAFDMIISRYKLDPKHINLEITESAYSTSQRRLRETIKGLNNKGFGFSLDDYGTGYSNFSYMFDLPFTIIKLDKSILWNAVDPKTDEKNENAMILLENSIHMLKQMEYKLLVEGVETVAQKMVLESFGCDYFQGFYFSKPLPGGTFIDYIKVVNG